MNVILRNQPETTRSGVWNGKQAAAYCGVCYRTFMKQVAAGNIPHRKIGRLRVFSRNVIDRWLEGEDFKRKEAE